MSTATADAPVDVEALSQTHPVLFFDGVCGLCNYYVDFVLKRDKNARFRFAPLQGEAAAKVLSNEDRENLNSLVLLKDGRQYRRTAAVVRILWQLSWPWQLAGSLLWLIPAPLRDFGYKTVARYRYAWFGQKATCRMPSPEERSRFLD